MEHGTNRPRPETNPSPSEPSKKSRTLENRGLRLRQEDCLKATKFQYLTVSLMLLPAHPPKLRAFLP